MLNPHLYISATADLTGELHSLIQRGEVGWSRAAVDIPVGIRTLRNISQSGAILPVFGSYARAVVWCAAKQQNYEGQDA